MSGLKPIETVYKGYRFRSRTEARWAVFFDSLGLKWEYEKQGYFLPSGPYLPDFWFPDVRAWIEIKGDNPTTAEIAKCTELAEESGYGVCILAGECSMDTFRRVLGCGPNSSMVGPTLLAGKTLAQIAKAFDDGRASRFEFGESGAPKEKPKPQGRAVRRAARQIRRWGGGL